MKPFLFLLLLLGLTQMLSAQPAPAYDSVLAKKLHTDERGMHMYVLAILKTGPAKITDKVLRDSLFKGHMANIGRLADEGKLVVAGPLEENSQHYRGIFILNATNLTEARKLVATDPTIKAGIFEVELYEWYGSAGLEALNGIHKRIQRPEKQ